jgi:phosphate transport system protein
MEDKATFEKLLREYKEEVVATGNLVEKALGRSIEALKKRDLNLAHQIIADDSQIDENRFDIEKKSIQLIAKYQPTVSDLNAIVAMLNIITELERIGDYAAGIAKIVIMIGDEPPLKPLIDIPRMAEITIDMIHNSLKSFMENDPVC